jgi:hypothetical protein
MLTALENKSNIFMTVNGEEVINISALASFTNAYQAFIDELIEINPDFGDI